MIFHNNPLDLSVQETPLTNNQCLSKIHKQHPKPHQCNYILNPKSIVAILKFLAHTTCITKHYALILTCSYHDLTKSCLKFKPKYGMICSQYEALGMNRQTNSSKRGHKGIRIRLRYVQITQVPGELGFDEPGCIVHSIPLFVLGPTKTNTWFIMK